MAARLSDRRRTGDAPAGLWVVLLLVLTSFGLLVAALATSQTIWAWGSVGASGVAAGLLVADWVSRRRAEPPTEDGDLGPERGRELYAEPEFDPEDGGEDRTVDDETAERPDTPSDRPPAVPIDPAVEPAEENTDVADAIAVSDLTDEVRVIDERPRYHLEGCRWVGRRGTIPLPVNEARELGFTPCAICTPDARLAAFRRATR